MDVTREDRRSTLCDSMATETKCSVLSEDEDMEEDEEDEPDADEEEEEEEEEEDGCWAKSVRASRSLA